MNSAPDIWMFDTLVECCTVNFGWNYAECIGSEPGGAPTPTTTPGLYYPDWLGDEKICKNDNGQPVYMTNNPSLWMFDTLDECCSEHFSWNYNTVSRGLSVSVAPVQRSIFMN